MSQSKPSAPFDCEAALLACARGDRAALRQIYEHEASQLLGVAFRIVHRRDLADEVVQDAFLQIWQKAGTFDPQRGSARAWIFTIVRYRALNTLRKTSREIAVDQTMLSNEPDTATDLLERLSRMTDAEALQRCLEQLDTQKRASILLAYVNGYSHSQIATHLETPLGTVKAWIRRGLLALRECLP
ncbi:sigma-70 family RNA polymerase sigma factor [Leptolyngbya sp. FACHB-36]|uniref:sigma-70 family RNA polymerase sigma factor n=1 Tax=Leptolyngbya sp. FACHB-36 TaxID=2692808 RepID=UPI001680EC5A|nr:sigma-70 family RNA polymerase sigma factor [Leptolyngbya sp. FACHB-36]MBD2021653.1 sigma-70 family RNA polymerase sigma factor [Leptolyngbya sp. FACHB-36]